MEIFFGWLVFSILVGVLADTRGRSGLGFFFLSAFLSPLVGLIVVLVIQDLAKEAKGKEERRRERERQEREHEEQMEALRAATRGSESVPHAAASVADEIAKLGELLRQGLLTEAEFADQKAALLRRPA